MWLAGYWQERIKFNHSIIKACHQEKNALLEAKILVEDLGFTYLRLEDLENAEEYILKGLNLYQAMGNAKGIALAKRHLGKSALLKAEYELIEQDRHWQEYFEQAEALYTLSLSLLNELNGKSQNEELSLADLELDFGRLYWLWGRKSERDSKKKYAISMRKSSDLYEKSIEASERGLKLFNNHKNSRGQSKALGNLGNVHKQIGLSYLASSKKDDAWAEFKNARGCYEQSLEIAQEIKKVDEIAHAKWGLAEIYELYVNEWEMMNKIDLALEFARDSNTLYRRMVTPDDIRVTQALVDRIRSKQNENSSLAEQLVDVRPSKRSNANIETISDDTSKTHHSQFNIIYGDNSTINIRPSEINISGNYENNKAEIEGLLAGLKESVDDDRNPMRENIVTDTDRLIEAIRKGKEFDKVQGYWEQVKEGIKTGGAAATILATVARLLGLQP